MERCLPALQDGCLRAGPAAAGAIVSAGATSLVGLLTWRGHRSQAGAARAMSPSRKSAPPAPRSGAGRSAATAPQPAIERLPDIHLDQHGVCTGHGTYQVLR